MQDESPKLAIKWMHKAVPLMLQLDISPTPYNYGIWYEYVSNRNKKLNQLMDNTLRKLGSIPNFLSRDLFNEFISYKDLEPQSQNQKRIEDVASQLESSSLLMNTSLADLNDFLAKSRNALKRLDKQKYATKEEHISKVINYLDVGTNKALEASAQFSTSLQQAQEEIQQLKRELAELKSRVDIDPLTDLENEVAFERHLYDRLPMAEDDISIILLDIDDLGMINTRHGKRVGTSLIRYIAGLLNALPSENAHIARIHGGRFGILLIESTLDFAHEYAERIRHEVSQQKIRHKQSKVSISQITVSIGVATLVGKESGENLMSRAKKNLVRAKETGKNCTCSH